MTATRKPDHQAERTRPKPARFAVGLMHVRVSDAAVQKAMEFTVEQVAFGKSYSQASATKIVTSWA